MGAIDVDSDIMKVIRETISPGLRLEVDAYEMYVLVSLKLGRSAVNSFVITFSLDRGSPCISIGKRLLHKRF
jgi:hypothetical protein